VRYDVKVPDKALLIIYNSGCTTFLKTIAGEMNGIHMSDDAYINYQGEPHEQIVRNRSDR
jgi:hypothetical protein